MFNFENMLQGFSTGMRRCMLMLLFLTVDARATNRSNSSPCQAAVHEFLSLPSQRTLTALTRADETGCWAVIESSNRKLNRLNRWAEHGNRWAAQYSAKHLKQFDGGNLEDTLIALGQFSDHDMERLLLFAKQGLLSKGELSDALTMLPLTLSDRPSAQLAVLKARRSKVVRLTRADLRQQRIQALSAIDEFDSEIKLKR